MRVSMRAVVALLIASTTHSALGAEQPNILVLWGPARPSKKLSISS